MAWVCVSQEEIRIADENRRPRRQNPVRLLTRESKRRVFWVPASSFFVAMSDNQTRKVRHDDSEHSQTTIGKKRSFRKDKLSLSNWLEDHPVLFVVGAIFVLVIIAFVVWIALRCLQSFLRSMGITWFSMNAGLSNWFSSFIGYAGAIATVVLGILTVRLSIKQDQSNDYAAISELQLSNFRICDLWHEYTPSHFERDQGRRFVLVYDIKGLKAYYSIRSIELYWKPAGKESAQYIKLENQVVQHRSTCETKVTAYFDEFPNCDRIDSIYYFLRLDFYEPKMMTPEEKRRWLQMHIKLDYADDKMESDVYCDYLLEYTGISAGVVSPEPVDRRVKISSHPKKRRNNP